MKTSIFDYHLPKKLIAHSPASPRDHSKLMIINRQSGKISHHKFYEIEKYLNSNDVLILNKTKVFPARIQAKKITGGKVELLFIEEIKPGIWTALTRPGLKTGTMMVIKDNQFEVVRQNINNVIINTHISKSKFMSLLRKHGRTPIPFYIKSPNMEIDIRKKYQTVYANTPGSVAAPTAGLHFTKKLLKRLKNKGIGIEYVTLHVGLGTFLPIRTEKIEDHVMHSEHYEIGKGVAERLNLAKKRGRRIVAVGTTSARVLETTATDKVRPCQLDKGKLKGSTNLFIYPPYKFKFVDALITNFHLPHSTLLALVSSFVSYPNTAGKFINFEKSIIGKAYRQAIKQKYRFYSFGDSSLII